VQRASPSASGGVAHDAGSSGRVTGVDPLRAVAALAVFACHINAYWRLDGLPSKLPQLLEAGAHGVDLFVVVSGFCLALPLIRTAFETDTRRFWSRRATRLLPPYYVALAFAAVLAMGPGTWDRVVAQRASFGDLLLHVALLQTWVTEAVGSINGSFWSIALEAQLYLAFPLTLWAWRRWGAFRVVVGTMAVSVVWSVLAEMKVGWVIGSDLLIPARLVEFAAGMWCAELVARRARPPRAVLWAGLIAGGAVAMIMSSSDVRVASLVVWTIPCSSAVLLMAGSRDDRPAVAWLAWVGTLSYSFYLVHQPLLLMSSAIANDVAPDGLARLVMGMTVGTVCVLTAAFLLNRFVEKPSQSFARRLYQPVSVEV
jgi:exopolysaccharide production protein ExoZ